MGRRDDTVYYCRRKKGKMKLSICVVTMNRAEQLKEALESCLKCNLPNETEFVVIDNASTDNTEEVVRSTLAKYTYHYEKMKVNLGCGGGRNYGYEKCSGEYIYVLDDDAIVQDVHFFDIAIKVLDRYTDIVTLTSQIYDTVWKRNRLSEKGKLFADNIYYCKIFCGGSHFIRRSFFLRGPYLSNEYGYEEILPSMIVWDSGKLNAYLPMIKIIHNPRNNKWNLDDERNNILLINECAIQYAVKKALFPKPFDLISKVAYKLRCKKYLASIPDGNKKADETVVDISLRHPIYYRVHAKTMMKLLWLFGFSIF